MQKQKHQ